MGASFEELSLLEPSMPLLECRRSLTLPVACRYARMLPDVLPEEAYLLLSFERRRQHEREGRVRSIAEFLVQGKNTLTLELGCQSGQMSLALQQATGGRVVSIDRDDIAIRQARERVSRRPEISLNCHDFLDWNPPRCFTEKVDQIVASHFFHEVFSTYGESGYKAGLEKCSNLLKPGGHLIILDGLCPRRESVDLHFRDAATRRQLDQFRAIYQASPVDFDALGHRTCRLDTPVLARFLNTLKFIVPDDVRQYEDTLHDLTERRQQAARAFFLLEYYTQAQAAFQAELRQDFNFYSEEQWRSSLQATGLRVHCFRAYNERRAEEAFWTSGFHIRGPLDSTPKIRALIVAEKGSS